ncbi:MAG: hypothetical protein QXD23_01060 [Candidatus Micrarchaeaceae archaeon]
MGLFDLFGKKDVSQDVTKTLPFMLVTEFVPYKIKSREKNNCSLNIKIKNLTKEPVLSSIVIEVPKQLSFDAMGISKQKEVKIGNLGPNEEKISSIDIHGGVGTDKGSYTITITAFVHYRDYAHVINEMRKRTILEVI